jgi:hypothetical protein
VGRHLGVQFHPELDADQQSRWFAAGADVVAEAVGVLPAELLATTASLEQVAAARVDRLVEGFLARAA